MNQTSFLTFQLISTGVLILLGLALLLNPFPTLLKKSSICYSARVMGFAILILPIASLCDYICEVHQMELYYNRAIHITTSFISSILITLAFILLLGGRINFKSFLFEIAAVSSLLFPVLVWGVVGRGNQTTIDSMMIVAFILFVTAVGIEVTYLLQRYKIAKNSIDEFYADDIEIQIRWIRESALLLSSFAVILVVAPILFSYSPWIGVFFLCYALLCYTFIFRGYHKMVIALMEMYLAKTTESLHKLEIIPKDDALDDASKSILSPEIARHIEQYLTVWVEQKNYLKKGITIQGVSGDLYTNRTYLSLYINKVYHCSFKVWITGLRIEEAKRMLCAPKEYTMVEISKRIGFSSPTSFIHVFSNYEHSSPAKWRNERRKEMETTTLN